MATENIDNLQIAISDKGAVATAKHINNLTSALTALENVLPSINSNLVGMQSAFSTSSNSIGSFVNNIKSNLSSAVSDIESQTSKANDALSGLGETDSNNIDSNLSKTAEDVKELENSVRQAGESWEYLSSPIAIVESRISRLQGQVDTLKQKFANETDVNEQEKLRKKIEDTTTALQKQEKQREKMIEESNTPSVPTSTSQPTETPQQTGTGISAKDVSAVTSLMSKFGLLSGKASSLVGTLTGAKSAIAGISTGALAAGAAVGGVTLAFVGMNKIAKQVDKTTKAIGTALLKVADSARKVVQSKIQEFTAPFEKLFDRIFRVALNRFLRFAINQITQGFLTGMQNVAKGMESANAVLSQYSTRLMYLHNTLGAMLIPVLKALYPIFINITNVIIRASNALNQFISLLNGSNKWIKAKEVYVDYAGSIDKSSKKAKKSVDKLTASFDELHDLTPSSASGSGDDEDMSAYFTDVGIEANISDFYKRLKAGFEKGDLTDIGVLVGDKINAALRNIDKRIKWENVGRKVENTMKALATFLIGAIGRIDFSLIGQTFADGLNTIFKALKTFEQTLLDANFYSNLGAKVGEFLYTMLTTIDWEGIGTFLLDKLISVFSFANGFLGYLLDPVSKEDPTPRIEAIVKNIFEGFKTAIQNTDTGVIGDTVGNLIVTVFTLGASIFEQSKFWESLASAINTIIQRITDNKDKISASMKRFVKSAANLVVTFLKNLDIKSLVNAITDVVDDVLKDPETKKAIREASAALGELAGEAWKVKFKLGLSSLSATVASWLNKVAGYIDAIFAGTSVEKFVKGKYSSGGGKKFATGGFPEDGIFSANHNELVGTFSNGKTAVANNAEITQGIYKAVRDAMADAGNTSGSGNGDVYLDSTKVGKVVAKGVFKEANRAGYKVRSY